MQKYSGLVNIAKIFWKGIEKTTDIYKNIHFAVFKNSSSFGFDNYEQHYKETDVTY